MTMANSTGDDGSLCHVTNGVAQGDPVAGAAEERANFIRAVGIGLEDLGAGREHSFDDAATRLGLDRDKALP